MAYRVLNLSVFLFSFILLSQTSCQANPIDIKSKTDIKNVILISIDSANPGYFGFSGYSYNTTPSIDSLAKKSFIFDNAMTTAPVCLPAHSSMLTGTIPPYHGIRDNLSVALNEKNITLAEILKKKGFKTAAFVGSKLMDKRFGLNQGFDVYDDTFSHEIPVDFPAERRGVEVSERANQWLEKNGNKPFFLFVHFFDPHQEYLPPKGFQTPAVPRQQHGPFMLWNNQDSYRSKDYQTELAYTDRAFSLIWQQLKTMKIEKNTLIVITSGHGQGVSMSAEKYHSFTVGKKMLNIPMIFRLPGIDFQTRIDNTVGIIDLVPTICSLLNVKFKHTVHGNDLTPFFENPKKSNFKNQFYYFETYIPTKYRIKPQIGLLSDQWKYVRTNTLKLFDVKKDKYEQYNVSENYTEQLHEMDNYLTEIIAESQAKHHKPIPVDVEPWIVEDFSRRGHIVGQIDLENMNPLDLNHREVIYYHNAMGEIYRNLSVSADAEHQMHQPQENVLNRVEKSYIDQFIVDFPDLPQAHFYLGLLRYEQQNPQEAVEHIEKAMYLGLKDKYAYYKLAQFYMELDNKEEALSTYQEAIKVFPESKQINLALSKCYYEQKNFEQATKYCKAILKSDPKNKEAKALLKTIKKNDGKFELGDLFN